MNTYEKEIIDALLAHKSPFSSLVERVFIDPEDERAVFIMLESGLTFHITVKLVQ